MSESPGSEPSIRVVVVDDSAAVRRLLSRAFELEDGFELVATASDGETAIPQIERARPDVVVLDLVLPGLSGTAVLTSLRQRMPALPIVIFSNLPRQDSGAVFDALSAGAVEFVPKPTGALGGKPMTYLRTELLPVLRLLTGRSRPHVAAVSAGLRPRPRIPPTLITVASSTGGPEALAALLRSLRPFPALPMLVVQHMPERFTGILAHRLDSLTTARVSEATDGGTVVPGDVLVAPGGWHMSVVCRGDELVVRLDQGPKVNFCRPSADVLFRSAAATVGPGVLAVVLSGMGRDGGDGAAAVVRRGGEVLAQSVESAVIGSMPAAASSVATALLPVEQLAGEILNRCARSVRP